MRSVTIFPSHTSEILFTVTVVVQTHRVSLDPVRLHTPFRPQTLFQLSMSRDFPLSKILMIFYSEAGCPFVRGPRIVKAPTWQGRASFPCVHNGRGPLGWRKKGRGGGGGGRGINGKSRSSYASRYLYMSFRTNTF